MPVGIAAVSSDIAAVPSADTTAWSCRTLVAVVGNFARMLGC